MESAEGLVTVIEAAEFLGRHPETVRRLIRLGRLPVYRNALGGKRRVRVADLESLAEYRLVGDQLMALPGGGAERQTNVREHGVGAV